MNVCLHLCNHHPDQGNFNFHHLQDSLCFSQSILFSTKVATVMVLITIVLLVLELHISGIVYYVCYCFGLLLFKIMSEIHLWVGTIINLYFTEVENRIRRFKQLAQSFAAGQIQDLNPRDLNPELAVLPTELRITINFMQQSMFSCLYFIQILDLPMHCNY